MERSCDVFERHLCSSLPKLAEHLTVLGLRPEFYLTEWLVPLWCRSLCPEASALTLNMLLLEGDSSLARCARRRLCSGARLACVRRPPLPGTVFERSARPQRLRIPRMHHAGRARVASAAAARAVV